MSRRQDRSGGEGGEDTHRVQIKKQRIFADSEQKAADAAATKKREGQGHPFHELDFPRAPDGCIILNGLKFVQLSAILRSSGANWPKVQTGGATTSQAKEACALLAGVDSVTDSRESLILVGTEFVAANVQNMTALNELGAEQLVNLAMPLHLQGGLQGVTTSNDGRHPYDGGPATKWLKLGIAKHMSDQGYKQFSICAADRVRLAEAIATASARAATKSKTSKIRRVDLNDALLHRMMSGNGSRSDFSSN